MWYQILSVGFGLEGDIQRLTESFPHQRCYSEIINFQDLLFRWKDVISFATQRGHVIPSGAGTKAGSKSLSSMTYCICGQKLDKTMQVSNWELRPLCADQLKYAATDAFCLLMISDSLDDRFFSDHDIISSC